jgi:hypothetical protein
VAGHKKIFFRTYNFLSENYALQKSEISEEPVAEHVTILVREECKIEKRV